jgi:Flp pilus assembly protein TadD
MTPAAQAQYDDAMYHFSKGEYAMAADLLQGALAADPANFEAQLALGMAYYRQGDYSAAITEGHKAEQLRPQEQLVHTNLSLFYVMTGNKTAAEHHGLQARIASWRENPGPPGSTPPANPELDLAKPKPAPVRIEGKFPEMPWKKLPPK